MNLRQLKRRHDARTGYQSRAPFPLWPRGPHPFCQRGSYEDDDDYWDGDQDEYACTRCGGEGWDQVDDPLWDDCDEFGYGECSACAGTGLRSHQTVF